MPFIWKDSHHIFKGEGIYFLTFAVKDRLPLLGELSALTEEERRRTAGTDNRYQMGTSAMVRLTPLGFAISDDLQHIGDRHEGLKLCCKQLMPDHIHVVLWVQKDCCKSIKQITHGFRIGATKIAESFGIPLSPSSTPVHKSDVPRPTLPNSPDTPVPSRSYLLDPPFIRTLAHRGQLRSMIDYVHRNPDDAWMRRQNRSYYVIKRRFEISGLMFDIMGKSRLSDYPDRKVIALSRSLTEWQISQEVEGALRLAERGTVIYTAAINTAEKTVARAVRDAGWPLVVLLLDGFPPEGTEAARYYHPGGEFHQACGEGRLLILSPHPENYRDPHLIARTDAILKQKDEAKGLTYHPLPHDTKRWRMIAGNAMMERIVGENSPTSYH